MAFIRSRRPSGQPPRWPFAMRAGWAVENDVRLYVPFFAGIDQDIGPKQRTPTLSGGRSYRATTSFDGVTRVFNGSTDAVDYGNHTLSAVSAFIRVAGDRAPTTTPTVGVLINNTADPNGWRLGWHHVGGGFQNTLQYQQGGTWRTVSFGPVSANVFYNIGCRLGSSGGTTYRNGITVASSGLVPDKLGTSVPLLIGKIGSWYMDMRVADAMVCGVQHPDAWFLRRHDPATRWEHLEEFGRTTHFVPTGAPPSSPSSRAAALLAWM